MAALWPGPSHASETEAKQYCHLYEPLGEGAAVNHCIRSASYVADVCRTLGLTASIHALPPGFLARLIWQESRFRPGALSPKGAQGIAQFIPSTAEMRGLKDPYNPAEALWKSGEYLKALKETFGNWGLAAAAYKARETRVRDLVRSGRRVPPETEHYVRIITGHSVYDWKEDGAKDASFALAKDGAFEDNCVKLAAGRTIRQAAAGPGGGKSWGVELVEHFSPAVARRIYSGLEKRFPGLLGEEETFVARSRASRGRYTLMVGRDSRAEALAFCKRLRASGGICTIRRN